MKKALSLLLVLVLALGMSTVAFAADVVNGFDPDTLWEGIYEYTDLELSPHADFHPISFTIDGNNNTGFDPDGLLTDKQPATVGITPAQVKKAKLTVEIKASKGGAYLDDVGFIYTDSTASGTIYGVKITMISTFANNNPDGVGFSYRLYLSLKKSMATGESTYKEGVTVSGTFKNATDEIEDEEYYQFFDGRILKPLSFVRNLEGALDSSGDGILRMRALKGAKYWAKGSHDDWTEKDDAITEKYPAIDGVYHITQRGLTNVVNNVEFPNYDPAYYVYTPDGDTLKYVGRAGDKTLPLLETYYFSVSELDVDEIEPEDEDFDEEEDWDYDENAESGGDDLYPENPHDNPGTGK